VRVSANVDGRAHLEQHGLPHQYLAHAIEKQKDFLLLRCGVKRVSPPDACVRLGGKKKTPTCFKLTNVPRLDFFTLRRAAMSLSTSSFSAAMRAHTHAGRARSHAHARRKSATEVRLRLEKCARPRSARALKGWWVRGGVLFETTARRRGARRKKKTRGAGCPGDGAARRRRRARGGGARSRGALKVCSRPHVKRAHCVKGRFNKVRWVISRCRTRANVPCRPIHSAAETRKTTSYIVQ